MSVKMNTDAGCRWLSRMILCVLLGGACAEGIEATVGADVTLNCQYDALYYGRLAVCWGRGVIPNRGCGNEVIRADEHDVTSRLSERYLLMGDLNQGHVSLTIRQVQESDSGVYGCRVDIPGWFNDHKHEVTLTVVPAPPRPLSLDVREVKARTVTVRWTPGFDGGHPVTSYRIDFKNNMESWGTAVTTGDINPALTQVTLIDMRPAKSYNVRMFAVNDVGMSEASNVVSVTTKEAAPEGPPLDIRLDALSSRSIKAIWKAPRTELRNGILRSYAISYREYDSVSRLYGRWHHLSRTATQEQESVILNNLKPSTQYNVLIQARTSAGIGPAAPGEGFTLDEVPSTSTAETTLAATAWWEQTTASLPPVCPDSLVVELIEVKHKTVTLRWASGFHGGSPVTSFELEYKTLNASWDSTKLFGDISPNWTEATIIETHPATYNMRMFARNSVGLSDPSNVLTVTISERAGPATITATTRPTATTTTTAGHEGGQLSTTLFTDTQAAVSGDKSHGNVVAWVVPVVMLMVIVAIAITWQLKRMRLKTGTLSIGWLKNGSQRYRDTEPISEL